LLFICFVCCTALEYYNTLEEQRVRQVEILLEQQFWYVCAILRYNFFYIIILSCT
jgi:hypothetical protein